MCTSTVAMAPYPVNGISVTTVSYKPGKKSKSRKEEKMPTKPKAIVEELVKQHRGNQKDKVLLGYKYRKSRGNNMNITEAISTIAGICFDILEKVTEKEREALLKFVMSQLPKLKQKAWKNSNDW